MEIEIMKPGLLALMLLGVPATLFAGPSEEEIPPSREFQKCMLQKQLDENRDAIKAVEQMIERNKEDIKVVGYASIGTQSAINENKRFIQVAKQQGKTLSNELRKFSKVKVNCKELEAEARAAAMEKCLGGTFKLTEMDCRPMIEGNPELTLWKR